MASSGSERFEHATHSDSSRIREIRLRARCERYPIEGSFTISRGAKTEAEIIVAELTARTADGGLVRGRGECVPYTRYGETVDLVFNVILEQAHPIARGLDRIALQSALPAGAARNALDCAFWDLAAKLSGRPVWTLAGMAAAPQALITAYTLSLGSPAEMGTAAQHADFPLLKLKLAGDDHDVERVAAVRAGAPAAQLIVDANEGWTFDQLKALAPRLAALGVSLIEQPLPAGQDGALAGYASPIPLGADESCHETKDLPALAGLYQTVNIKLDKAGGLTEALNMKAAAEAAGFKIMVGCMVSTSLSMAPAFLVAQGADFVDLDGPLLLARDRDPALSYTGACIEPPLTILWG